MSIARIVTDSAAELAPEIVEELGITVVPWRLRLGSENAFEDASMRSTSAFRDMIKRRIMPVAEPPTAADFSRAYAQLARATSDIISIHASSHLSNVLAQADRGRREFMGRCRISTIDSEFMSRAQGLIVERAARAALDGASGPELVRYVNGLLPLTYLAFHVDVPDYLRRSGIMPDARENSTGLARTLLMLEKGKVVPLQRSRSRGTPPERLVEFVAEFQGVNQLAIMHTGLNPAIKDLRTLMSESLPDMAYEEHIYGPVLFTYLGPTAMGAVVFEG